MSGGRSLKQPREVDEREKDPDEVAKDPGDTLESKASCHMSKQSLWWKISPLGFTKYTDDSPSWRAP